MSTSAPDALVPRWHLSGQVIVACNCDYGCPCNFNGLPSTGKCEGSWSWHVEEGSYGDVPLSGLTFLAAVNWPGAIHEGNGEAILAIDEKADERQREALRTLLSGRAGGPWKIIATTLGRVHGPEFVPFEVELADYHSRVTAGSVLRVELTPVRNPVTGAEVHPRALLPEGFVLKDAQLAASAVFHVEGPVSFDHTGRYAASGPFEYEGP
jgi:hypothetical protein